MCQAEVCYYYYYYYYYLGRFFDFNMSNNQHMSELSSLVQDLMNDIDIKPLHPKHKLLLFSRYVLPKLSWHFTIANISKTWITEHLDSVVNGYIRKWLDIPHWTNHNVFPLLSPTTQPFVPSHPLFANTFTSLFHPPVATTSLKLHPL